MFDMCFVHCLVGKGVVGLFRSPAEPRTHAHKSTVAVTLPQKATAIARSAPAAVVAPQLLAYR